MMVSEQLIVKDSGLGMASLMRKALILIHTCRGDKLVSDPDRRTHIGEHTYHTGNASISGGFLPYLGEPYYRIQNYDRIDPFFISLVSSSEHWLFISSTGGLTAGRRNADSALFPYDTDDKVAASSSHTGHKAVLLVTKGKRTYLWEPFSGRYAGVYRIERNLYKNVYGDKLVFEETNQDLGLTYRYAWRTSDRYGFVKTAWLKDISGDYTKGLNEILQLQPIRFHYKPDNPKGYSSEPEEIGFIAQEVQKVFPEAVSEGDDGYLDMNLHAINVALVNAVKELRAENSALRSELEKQREEFEIRIRLLEAATGKTIQ